MGAGRSEVMHAIFGSLVADSGSISVDGQKVLISSPQDALKYGIGFVTEDRKNEGLFLSDAISNNIVIPSLDQHLKYKLINENSIDKSAEHEVRKLNIKCDSIHQPVGNLSGGNQQKVVLAKWLEIRPKILILDEPTRGVDVGAKREIYHIIKELKESGTAIIVVSSELSEVIGVSDRVAVMRNGTLEKISYKNITKESILKIAFTGAGNE
ncbi:ATP-binding cassette domain-containing protein [Vibrio sp. SS-MA-C1-2]|nr:ATP-binding cassette domain-containing protein [Vibrio sp. SS-MA-C1-2]